MLNGVTCLAGWSQKAFNMCADYVVTVKVNDTNVSWARTIRLWNPRIFLLNHASLRPNCSIIIKSANLLLESK